MVHGVDEGRGARVLLTPLNPAQPQPCVHLLSLHSYNQDEEISPIWAQIAVTGAALALGEADGHKPWCCRTPAVGRTRPQSLWAALRSKDPVLESASSHSQRYFCELPARRQSSGWKISSKFRHLRRRREPCFYNPPSASRNHLAHPRSLNI